jgi:hypothetical protein
MTRIAHIFGYTVRVNVLWDKIETKIRTIFQCIGEIAYTVHLCAMNLYTERCIRLTIKLSCSLLPY